VFLFGGGFLFVVGFVGFSRIEVLVLVFFWFFFLWFGGVLVFVCQWVVYL